MVFKPGGHKMDNKDFKRDTFRDLQELTEKCSKDSDLRIHINSASERLLKKLIQGGTVFSAGNGGSAAQAQHFSAELVGRFLRERKALSSICLNTDTSILTSLSNDYDFSDIFKRQIEAHGTKKDALLVFSTSGRSTNIIKAIEAARSKQITTVLLTGQVNEILAQPDFHIQVPSRNTPLIQTIHMHIMHSICNYIETYIHLT